MSELQVSSKLVDFTFPPDTSLSENVSKVTAPVQPDKPDTTKSVGLAIVLKYIEYVQFVHSDI